jgi:hypothetical protein
MKYDTDAMNKKRSSLVEIASKISIDGMSMDKVVAGEIIDNFTWLKPPEKDEIVMGMMTISGGNRPRAKSKKLGNLVLSWRRLMEFVPDSAVVAFGAHTFPSYMLPLVGLQVWNMANKAITVEFTELEATVITALWKNCDNEYYIEEAQGHIETNTLRQLYELPTVTQVEYTKAIDTLVSAGCIKLTDGKIWLKEWIRRTYS